MKDSDLRKFGLLLGGIIPGLFGILFPLLKGRSLPYWPWVVSIPLVFLALFFPAGLKGLHRVWGRIGHVLGWINTRILLTLLFFLVFTPVGWIRRLLGKDLFSASFGKDRFSYRVESQASSREDMEKPY